MFGIICYMGMDWLEGTAVPEKLGPFIIGRLLGRGGMGKVYEGTCETDGVPVAVKVLTYSQDNDEESRDRFEHEIETLKRLNHPNVVGLIGFGEEQGQLYYAMEVVDGTNLQQELRRKRQFQWYEVAKVGLDICQALRHAHDRGITHRDIKPANILLDQNGKVKLSDFGIARFFGDHQQTGENSVVGTLGYMSPEQALASPVGSRADLYSLGCVLYALLTGKPPVVISSGSANTLQELLAKHKTPPISIRSIRTDVPESLDHIILDLLQFQPEDRPRYVSLVLKRLQSLLHALWGNPSGITVLPSSKDKSSSDKTAIPPAEPLLPDTEQPHHDSPQLEDVSLPSPGSLLSAPTLASHSPQADGQRIDDARRVHHQADTVMSLSMQQRENIPASQQSQSEVPPINNDAIRDVISKPLTHFTAIAKEDLDTFDDMPPRRPIFSQSVFLASAMLLIVGLTVYYFIQPASPEVLLARITAAMREGNSQERYSMAQLAAAQSDVQTFLSTYSDHPSADIVRTYQAELELSEHERRLERRLQLSALHTLSPVERAYVEILAVYPHTPDLKADKLRAFIAVFQSDQTEPQDGSGRSRMASSPVDVCVELARRQLRKLEQNSDDFSAVMMQVLRRRLEEAASLEESNLRHAEDIKRGIIELYRDHRWAEELIKEIKISLGE